MSDRPMLGGCCVCLDERGWTENPLVYCDGESCNVAVHQACYGIVKVPDGPWFCRKCESQERAAKVKCELCPHREGALKKTDGGGWAHVVCALYIPEVTFNCVMKMEPIILAKVPSDRYNKVCFICEEQNRSSKANTGACMNCAKLGCKASFHVTCAQISGLLSEESTGVNQTKYCGYCKAHLPKRKKEWCHKNLSSTKLYKCRANSSSEEVISPEEEEYFTAESFPKPGDIRYTKAGKKRSKSLEESLAAERSQTEDEENMDETYTPPENDAENEESVHTDKTAPSDKKAESNCEHAPKDQGGEKKQERDNDGDNLSPESGTSKTNELESTLDGAIAETDSPMVFDESGSGETVRAATRPSDAPDLAREASKAIMKRPRKEGKIVASNKRLKDGGKGLKKDKRKQLKKNKSPLSGFIPHRPTLPQPTDPDRSEGTGTAIYPRQSFATLDMLGLDRSDACDPLDTAENNRIFKNDLVGDGLTEFEKMMNDQMSDAFKFLCEEGTDSEVSSLLVALKKIREDNDALEHAIESMTHRKEQLMLLKTKLSSLQVQSSVAADSNMAKQPGRPTPSPMKSQHPIVEPNVNMQAAPQVTAAAGFSSPSRKAVV